MQNFKNLKQLAAQYKHGINGVACALFFLWLFLPKRSRLDWIFWPVILVLLVCAVPGRGEAQKGSGVASATQSTDDALPRP
jgi:ABC-type polysaccharide/polyol phosphate export permease